MLRAQLTPAIASAARLADDLLELAGDKIEGFVPTGRPETITLPDERGRETVRNR